jgi:heme/copper-type cytochrome/quinol oxidase subunit 2
MRLLILALCALLVAGFFATMFVSLWATRRSAESPTVFRQSLAADFVWTAIPCLMLLAAAIPAVVGFVSGRHQ